MTQFYWVDILQFKWLDIYESFIWEYFLCAVSKLQNLLKCHFSLHKRWISFMWFWSVYCIQHPIIDVTSIIYKDIENVIKASDFFWGQKNNSLFRCYLYTFCSTKIQFWIDSYVSKNVWPKIFSDLTVLTIYIVICT